MSQIRFKPLSEVTPPHFIQDSGFLQPRIFGFKPGKVLKRLVHTGLQTRNFPVRPRGKTTPRERCLSTLDAAMTEPQIQLALGQCAFKNASRFEISNGSAYFARGRKTTVEDL